MNYSEYLDASTEALNTILSDVDTRIRSLEWIGGGGDEYNDLVAKRDAISQRLDNNFLGNLD